MLLHVEDVNEKEDEKAPTIEHLNEKGISPSQVLESSDNDSAISIPNILAKDRRILAERLLVRKLDLRLMPMVLLLFIINYIDVSFIKLSCVLT